MPENNSTQTCLFYLTPLADNQGENEVLKTPIEYPANSNLTSPPKTSCDKSLTPVIEENSTDDAFSSNDTDAVTCLSLPPYEIKISRETVDISFGKLANGSQGEKNTEIDVWRPSAMNKENYLLITPKRKTTKARKRKATWVDERCRRHFEAIIFNLRRRTYFLATCDVLVNVSSRSFPCHSFILMSHSTYFLNYLKKPKHSDERKHHTFLKIYLDHLEVTINAFQVIHAWMYTSSMTLDESNIADVWHAGNKLQMFAVVNFCRQEVHRILNPTNALSMWESADKCGLRELRQMAAHIAAWNFVTVTHSGRFLQFDITKVIRLLRDQSFNVLNFKDIQEAALRWINYGKEERVALAEKLLQILSEYSQNTNDSYVLEEKMII